MQILLDAAQSFLKQTESRNEENRRNSKITVERKAQLPPSSYQSFLKEKHDIVGFVLRPFGQQYTYKLVKGIQL